MMGIYRPRPFEQFHRVNWLNSSFLLFLVFFSVATILYVIFEADNFDEYSESFSGVANGIVTFCLFIGYISKTPDIFQLISDFEKTIAQSKYLGMHSFICHRQCIENEKQFNDFECTRNGKVCIIETHVRKDECCHRKMDFGAVRDHGTRVTSTCTLNLCFDNSVDSLHDWTTTRRL